MRAQQSVGRFNRNQPSMRRGRCRRAALGLALGAGAALVGVGGASATDVGTDGCPAEFWAANEAEWQEYGPAMVLDDLFDFPDTLASFRSQTLANAVATRGDISSPDGAVQQLLHDGVVAYLNAADESLGYPFRRFTDPFFMERRINDALQSGDVTTIAELANTLDAANNSTCPMAPELSQAGPVPGGIGSGSPTGTIGGSVAEDLPDTGADVIDALLIGLALCAAGAVALIAVRRRPVANRFANR